MSRLTRILPAVVIMLALPSFAQDWECQQCPKRSVARFDLDVGISEADWQQLGYSSADYMELYQVAAGVFGALFNDDPSRKCLSYYEGALDVQLTDGAADLGLATGGTYTSLPPSGGSVSTNYMLTGSIESGGGNALIIYVAIVASETGDIVVEGQRSYDPGNTGYGNGKSAGHLLIPLMEKIRAFEKTKRDSDAEVVIEFSGSKKGELVIEPEKEKLKGLEEVDVKVRVKDCDAMPVKNMELQLSCDDGAIDPAKITTDVNGEAVVSYTAPCGPGNYAIRARFYYHRPFEAQASAEQWKSYEENEREIEVEAGDKFKMVYAHTSVQEYGGVFKLQSVGHGDIQCTVDWDAEPPSVQGSGTVSATWMGNADQCVFSGESNFVVNFEGSIVSGENNTKFLKIRKTGESDQGGVFKITCAGMTQQVPESFPIPVQEEDRMLTFELQDGATNAFDVPGTDTHYSYTLDMSCK